MGVEMRQVQSASAPSAAVLRHQPHPAVLPAVVRRRAHVRSTAELHRQTRAQYVHSPTTGNSPT